MKKESFLKELESKNEYCLCSNLSNLFNLRKRAINIEEICDNYKRQLNLQNPSKKDLSKILNYKENVEEMNNEIGNYSKELYELIKSGRLVIENYPFNKEEIMTVNCPKCYKQLDVI